MSKPTFLVLALSVALAAQQPVTPPATGGQESEVLRRAFVDATADRSLIYAAANHVQKSDAEGRARFMATLHAIAVAAAKLDESASAGDKPTEIADEVRSLMTDVVVGPAPPREAALAKLSAQPETGGPAIAQLQARGTTILQRCLQSYVRAKMTTNALYAGQFDELKDFMPEAGETLLAWAKTPPKEASPPGSFRAACLRALRDVEPADKATDELRRDLRTIAQQAQRANDDSLFLTAVCALHQFGDASLFDKLEKSIEEQANTEDPQQKLTATSTLADLYYQLRRFDAAATYFQAVVELQEKAGQPPEAIASTSYNTSCSLALAGKPDEAFTFLEKALQYGSKSRQLSKAMLDEDHDTNSLRSDPRFAKLMEQYFGNKGKPAK